MFINIHRNQVVAIVEIAIAHNYPTFTVRLQFLLHCGHATRLQCCISDDW